MILILITLLALSASQVTALQERMAGIYRADNLAFQNSEARLRQAEHTTHPDYECDLFVPAGVTDPTPPPIPTDWTNPAVTVPVNASRQLVNLGEYRGSGWTSDASYGQTVNYGGLECSLIRFTTYATDSVNPADRTSSVVVQSIAIPRG